METAIVYCMTHEMALRLPPKITKGIKQIMPCNVSNGKFPEPLYPPAEHISAIRLAGRILSQGDYLNLR
jgi:hypothetical protein